MRIFYIIQPREPEVLNWFNVLRFLANPRARRAAHITAKGPFDHAQDVNADSKLIQGQQLTITGVGSFWGENQATALLQIAHNDILLKIWHKPSYNEFNPHITICDQLTKAYTQKVLDCLQAIRPCAFHASELKTLISNAAPGSSELLTQISNELLSDIIGQIVTLENVLHADEETRLAWLRCASKSQPTVAKS